MKKRTRITQDKTQTRSTIPSQFVKDVNIDKDTHITEWELKNGKLKAEVIKNE